MKLLKSNISIFLFSLAVITCGLFILFNTKSSILFADKKNIISIDGISIEFPSGWSISKIKNVTGKSVFLLNINSPGYSITGNLLKEDLKKKMTAEDFFAYSIAEIKKLLLDFKAIERKENYHIFSTKIADTEIYQFHAYYLHGKKAYILAFSGSKEIFLKQKNIIINITKTFKITK
jgi:hypothetical protein